MKSYDELTKICQSYKGLTEDERRKNVATIVARKKSRQDERASRQGECDDLQKKIDEIADRRRGISREIFASAEKTQKMLAYSIESGEIFEAEKKLVDEDKLLARTSAGLQVRLNDSKREFGLLEEEEAEDEYLLKILRLVHLPGLLNVNGVERSRLMEELIVALGDLGGSFYPGSGGLKVVTVSNFDSAEIIPRFLLCGDDCSELRDGNGRPKNIWVFREFIHSLQAARGQIKT